MTKTLGLSLALVLALSTTACVDDSDLDSSQGEGVGWLICLSPDCGDTEATNGIATEYHYGFIVPSDSTYYIWVYPDDAVEVVIDGELAARGEDSGGNAGYSVQREADDPCPQAISYTVGGDEPAWAFVNPGGHADGNDGDCGLDGDGDGFDDDSDEKVDEDYMGDVE